MQQIDSGNDEISQNDLSNSYGGRGAFLRTCSVFTGHVKTLIAWLELRYT